jgi:hypothetical protein
MLNRGRWKYGKSVSEIILGLAGNVPGMPKYTDLINTFLAMFDHHYKNKTDPTVCAILMVRAFLKMIADDHPDLGGLGKSKLPFLFAGDSMANSEEYNFVYTGLVSDIPQMIDAIRDKKVSEESDLTYHGLLLRFQHRLTWSP